jgi:hypothetical protein
LAADAPPLLPPEAIFDWDLAAAVHAADVAFDKSGKAHGGPAAAAGRGTGRQGASEAAEAAGESPREAAAAAAACGGGSSSAGTSPRDEGRDGGGGAGARPADFKRFMAKIGQDFQKAGEQVAMGLHKAFDETQKGLQKVAQVGSYTLLCRCWSCVVSSSRGCIG